MRAKLERLLAKLDRGISSTIEVPAGEVFEDVHAELERILTASDWIPVSERLPPEYAQVWMWSERRGGGRPVLKIGALVVRPTKRIHGQWKWYSPGADDPHLYGYDVIAWQPIEEPAPYRAEGGE